MSMTRFVGRLSGMALAQGTSAAGGGIQKLLTLLS
jgi:hypothetical protein